MPRRIPYQRDNSCKHCRKLLLIKPRMNYKRMSQPYQSKTKTFLMLHLNRIASFAFTLGLSLFNVKFKSSNFPRRFEDFKILDETDYTESEQFTHAKARDEAMISYRKYRRFSKTANLGLSSEYKLRKIYEKIDSQINLSNNAYGYYLDSATKIKKVLTKTLEKMRTNNVEMKDNTFILKFCGDGTNITKSNLQIVNFAFTVINDSTTAMSAKGNYILGNIFLLFY